MAIQSSQAETISFHDLACVPESLTRGIVPEEVAKVAVKRPDVFHLKPDSPLREDLIEIFDRHRNGATKLYSHPETWNDMR